MAGSGTDVAGWLKQNLDGAALWTATVLTSVWSGGLALVNIVSLLVVTPIVAFYLLNDWDRMVAKVDQCLPRQHLETIRSLARQINDAMAGFIRGQGTVCLDTRAVLCHYPHTAGIELRISDRACGGRAQLHSVCRRDHRRDRGQSAWRWCNSGRTTFPILLVGGAFALASFSKAISCRRGSLEIAWGCIPSGLCLPYLPLATCLGLSVF